MNPLGHSAGSYWPSETTPPYTIKQEQASVICLDDDGDEVYDPTTAHSRRGRSTLVPTPSDYYSMATMSHLPHATTFYPMSRPSMASASSSHTSPKSPSGSAVDNALLGGTPGRQRVAVGPAQTFQPAANVLSHRTQHTPEATPPPISLNVQHLMQQRPHTQPSLLHAQEARRHSAMATTGYSMVVPPAPPAHAPLAASTRAPTPVPDIPLVDVRNTTTSSLADYAAQMICHLWFSPTPLTSLEAKRKSKPLWASPEAASDDATSNSFLSPLQEPTQAFRAFVHDAIKTTLVSHSVVIVALLYIYKLKCRNPFLMGGSGSEYRLAATSLMLANKFLDDNTYTLKTWASVTRMPLHEMLSMEVELLKCLEHDLTVRPKEYDAWLEMLHGFMRARAVVYTTGALPGTFGVVSPGPSVAEPRGRYVFHPGSTEKPRSSPNVVSSRARSSSPLRNARALAKIAAWQSRLAADVLPPPTVYTLSTSSSSSSTAPPELQERPAKRQARQRRPLSGDFTRRPMMASPSSLRMQTSTDAAGSVIPPRSSAVASTTAPARTMIAHDHLSAPFTYHQSTRAIDPNELVYYTLAASPVDARRLSAEQALAASAAAAQGDGGMPASASAQQLQQQQHVFIDELGRRQSVLVGHSNPSAQQASYASAYVDPTAFIRPVGPASHPDPSLATSPRGTIVLNDWAHAVPATAMQMHPPPPHAPLSHHAPPTSSSHPQHLPTSTSLAQRHVHIHRGPLANVGVPGYAYVPPELAPAPAPGFVRSGGGGGVVFRQMSAHALPYVAPAFAAHRASVTGAAGGTSSMSIPMFPSLSSSTSTSAAHQVLLPFGAPAAAAATSPLADLHKVGNVHPGGYTFDPSWTLGTSTNHMGLTGSSDPAAAAAKAPLPTTGSHHHVHVLDGGPPGTTQSARTSPQVRSSAARV